MSEDRDRQTSASSDTGGSFPDGFLWGAATSAYQIEGSPLADGAGPSIWHRFTHTPGRTHAGDTGDVACDHYRRYRADVGLMRDIGIQAYRFSVAWGRVLPEGRGRVNHAGLDFYSALVDTLLAAGIIPFLTLCHWDLPQALEEAGGWLNPEIAGWFADYARIVHGALGDRVPFWTTLNEPWVIVDAGYLHGVHAPGRRDIAEAARASHGLMRAHGAAVQALRADGCRKIGLVVNIEPKEPASDSPRDAAATDRADLYMNRIFLDAALLGRYPAGIEALFGDAWPETPAADLDLIRQPLDFIGVNYYTRSVVRDDPSVPVARAAPVRQTGVLHTDLGWEVHPPGLTRTLLQIKERYGGMPLYVTENGAAFPDPPQAAGTLVEDPLRVEYYRSHLAAAREAIRGGVDLRGYFAWSLMDNLEWASGFSKRFGLVHVDFKTQRRTPKSSAHFYGEVIRSRGRSLGGPPAP